MTTNTDAVLIRVRAIATRLINHSDNASMAQSGILILDALDAPETVTSQMIIERRWPS